eukprot:CAMPEP_0204899714 /NCGR_PEP_ID=MMETSP1397-20131031/2007_1 /ASSEMBLY_ACC=CAM_ASM_000891 /TAXON_ID=49980 /ORGANISM="Climacostomum Climacostomum virens, Strain Stock W-24" /LENGTH=163 /DNA_ID=CAMNT_0052067697 /DNA_START=1389 /DNA_END=1877 /DNA_ORIENTATION=-
MESEFGGLKEEGNALYKEGDYIAAVQKYQEAAETDDVQLKAICFANMAQCYIQLSQPDEAIKACDRALELSPDYVKVRDRKIRVLIDKKDFRLAKEAADAGDCDPLLKQEASRLADEQFEKDKEAMMGQLKGLGNTILGKFGLSLDNFKVEQNETGSYSVNFT